MPTLLLRAYLIVFAGIWLLGLAAVGGLISLGTDTTFGVCFAFPLAVWFFLSAVHLLLAVPALRVGKSSVNPEEILLPDEWISRLIALCSRTAAAHSLPDADEVRLHANTVAHVYETEAGKKILVIGAAALSLVSPDALAGIIAHELAHFKAADTTFLRQHSNALLRIHQLEDLFARSAVWNLNPLAWAVRGVDFWILWDLAQRQRQAEYAADRFWVEQVGEEATAKTLILVSVVGTFPWARLESIAELHAAMEIPLEGIFARQAERARRISASDWQDATRKVLKRKTAPLDSHPALRDRLKAIGIKRKRAVELARELELSGKTARELVSHWAPVEKRLTDQLVNFVRMIQEAERDFVQWVGRA